jgi:excisionase family DNA binding protein
MVSAMNSEITSKEAAELLEVSTGRIRQFVVKNRVRSRKVGNTRLIQRSDIEKIIKEREGRKAA